MAKLRSVSTYFWSDPFIEELNSMEKLLFLYLITNDKTNMLGIYESTERKISFETGIDINEIKAILTKFENAKKIKRVGNYFVLINFMKNQNYNSNMKKSAIEFYNQLPNELRLNNLQIDKANVSEGFERVRKALGTVSNHYGTVRKEEYEYEVEVEYKVEVESEDEVEGENPPPPQFENDFPVHVHQKKIDSRNCEIEKEKILSDQIYCEHNCMKNGLNEIQLKENFAAFIKQNSAIHHFWENEQDLRKHFQNWLPKKLNSKNNGKLRPTAKPPSDGDFGKL